MGISYNITFNCVSYISIITTKEELLVLGIKASGYYIRYITFIIRQVATVMR
jgi:hypothetical protein